MKNIILTPNPYRDKNFQTVRDAAEVLKAAGANVRLCLPFEVDRSYELPKDLRFSRLDREMNNADAVICFGGDGTILHMAKTATRRNLPILGVNIGTMGFMAELESGELDKLSKLVTGDYSLDRRMMLDVTVQRDRDIIFHDICLNDVVITKGAVARIVHLSVQCDGVQAMECSGDGVIISTPTGSTAYNISAGGPVLMPASDCFVITPICSQYRSSCPLVVSAEDVIEISIRELPHFIPGSDSPPVMDVDSFARLTVQPGSSVTFRKAEQKVRMLKLSSESFYVALKKKLSSNGG